MAKPDSIKKFDLFFWGAMALSVIGMIFSWGMMEQAMANSPEVADARAVLSDGAMDAIVWISMGFGLLLYVGIWFLISIKRIEFVKWIYLLFILWGLIQMPAGFEIVGGFQPVHIIGVISTILSLLAVWMTFRADSKEWFAEKRADKERDAFKPGVDLK